MELKIRALENYKPHQNRRSMKPLIAWGLSLILHTGYFSFLVYQGIHTELSGLEFVNFESRNLYSVILLDKYREKMNYPAGFFAPVRTKSLEEIARLKKAQEERLARARKKRGAEAALAAEQAKQEEEAERRKATEAVRAEADRKAAGIASGRFGRINIHPLKQHVQNVWSSHKKHELGIDTSHVRIGATFRIAPDGSIEDIRITESSPSAAVNDTAINLLKELGEQHALAPLSFLNAITLTLEVNPATATLSITGVSPGEVGASSLAAQLNGLLLTAKLTQKNPTAVALLQHLEVSLQGSVVSARMTMPREQATDIMSKNFGSSAQ